MEAQELTIIGILNEEYDEWYDDGNVRDAVRLLLEAVSLSNDISSACSYAEMFADKHPGLYLKILEDEKSAEPTAMVSIGVRVMEMIPKKYVVRSNAALKTADYMVQAGEQPDRLEACYFAAYESDTSAVNYLRALLNGYATEAKREELRKIYTTVPVNESRYFYGVTERNHIRSEREENRMDKNMLLMLRFFDGQFEEVMSEGLKKREALGWTGTFMKQGIALYLLLLYEGQWHGQGRLAMKNTAKSAMGFSEEEYRRGLKAAADPNKPIYQHKFCLDKVRMLQ